MNAIAYAARTDRGLVRSENQDAWFADPKAGVYGVTDGMGGHQAGAIAARLVADALPVMLAKRLGKQDGGNGRDVVAEIENVFAELSTSLRDEGGKDPRLRGMGATVVVALVRQNSVLIAHLGDSRAYLLRDRQLAQLTRDHSLVQMLVESGALTPQQAERHPDRAQITRYLGMAGNALPEVALGLQMEAGDRLLLCTDGLTGMISEQAVNQILAETVAPAEACDILVRAANEAGGKDNVTALIVDSRSPPGLPRWNP